MAREADGALGGIDILCHNAGIIEVGPVEAFPEETWDRLMAVNVKGVFLCCKACLPYMRKSAEGSIVNTASVAGKTGHGGVSAYCTSKFAVVGFTQSLSEELGPFNIRVNSVCPGFLRTAMWTDVLDPVVASSLGLNLEAAFAGYVLRNTPLRREPTPSDIGDSAVYMCRTENATGVTAKLPSASDLV